MPAGIPDDIDARRAMMKISEKIAAKNGGNKLSLQAKASDRSPARLRKPWLSQMTLSACLYSGFDRMDKNEVVEIARKIDTFETSILPYEDCCTVFVAKHPKTKPKLEEAKEYESRLSLDEMIERAIRDTEIMTIGD